VRNPKGEFILAPKRGVFIQSQAVENKKDPTYQGKNPELDSLQFTTLFLGHCNC
jgi:hypothetical protein